jgi:hypothetical protein
MIKHQQLKRVGIHFKLKKCTFVNQNIIIMVTVFKQGSSKASIRKSLEKLKSKRGLDAVKYCGVIKLKEHPVTIQKRLRDEWS